VAVAKKATAKKAVAKKSEPKSEELETVEEAAAPEMGGEQYKVGYLGVSQDDEDYSMAAEVKRLSE
jgi:hypothetical protein